MKQLFAIGILSIVFAIATGCNSAEGPKLLCDTTCLKDTIKFTGSYSSHPNVRISAKNCLPDSIIWSNDNLEADRKTGFTYLIGSTVRLNKDFVKIYFKDDAYAWVLFNDCSTGRGFQIKLPYDKEASFSLKSSGINSMDPKFSIAENLVVNTDRGNIFVEDMYTGKKAMMTFGQKLDIDYDNLHEYIDSVNVSNERIWVKIKVSNAWVEKEKKIVLE